MFMTTLIQLNWIIFSMLNGLFDMEFFSREEVACFTESCKKEIKETFLD